MVGGDITVTVRVIRESDGYWITVTPSDTNIHVPPIGPIASAAAARRMARDVERDLRGPTPVAVPKHASGGGEIY